MKINKKGNLFFNAIGLALAFVAIIVVLIEVAEDLKDSNKCLEIKDSCEIYECMEENNVRKSSTEKYFRRCQSEKLDQVVLQ